MAINLQNYSAIQTNMFVRLDIPGYQVLTFSDYHKAFTIAGTVYQGLGQLLSISNTSSNLRAAPENLTVSISGIPSTTLLTFLTTESRAAISVFIGRFSTPQLQSC